MNATIDKWNEWDRVCVDGNFELRSLGDTRANLEERAAVPGTRMLFDLSETQTIDSSAIALLVSLYKKTSAGHGGFAIVCPRANLFEIFTIAGLDKIVPIYPGWKELQQQLSSTARQ
jgi:anti-anti-sigma factor